MRIGGHQALQPCAHRFVVLFVLMHFHSLITKTTKIALLQYWENLLTPLDNMITRNTARFVSSKDPDYLTSVFQVRC